MNLTCDEGEFLRDRHAVHSAVVAVSGEQLDPDHRRTGFGALEDDLVGEYGRVRRNAQPVHVFGRNGDFRNLQVQISAAEVRLQVQRVLAADGNRDAGDAADVHQHLVGVDVTRAHSLFVLRQVERRQTALVGEILFRSGAVLVDVVYRCQQQRREFVLGEGLAELQRIGQPERRHARNVGAGHRRALHVAVLSAVDGR